MTDCLFCKIVAGSIPSTKVYEDEKIYAFKDIHPHTPIHYLFVPKEHYESLVEMPETKMELIADVFRAIKQVADRDGLSKNGYRTVVNTLKFGGQTVDHVHFHLMGGKQLGGNMAGL